MDKNSIKTGFITEAKLVELYGSPAQKKSYKEKGHFVSSYKSNLLKKVSKYCKIEETNEKKDGTNLYNITQVYNIPLPSNFDKMNKSLYQYIVPLILNSLINGHDKNNSIEITVGKWAREINMVNQNYNLVKFNREDTSTETQIQLDTINEFYDKADHAINYYISNALDYLKSAGLIIWREVNRITVEESDGTTIIDHDGNISLNINLITHQASKEEMDYYSQCIAIADKEAKIDSAGERYYSKKAPIFQNALKRELYKRKIKFVYSTYEAYYVHLDRCQALLDHFEGFNAKKFLDKFNQEFSDMLIENAGNRFDKNTKATLRSLYKNRGEYELAFGSLCDITINNETEYLGKRIQKKTNDDNYTLQITHNLEE